MSYPVELARTVERLRQLSEDRLSRQEGAFLDLLAAMAGRRVPRVDPRAWADQLTVIGRDVQDEDQSEVAQELIVFRRSFDLRP